MSQPNVLGVGVVLDESDDYAGISDGGLVVETAFIAEHPMEEVYKDAVLLWKPILTFPLILEIKVAI